MSLWVRIDLYFILRIKLNFEGDWLSEMTMTVHGSGKVKNGSSVNGNGQPSLEERKKKAMYAETFISCFEPAIPNLVKNGTKLAVNAGASDTELLAEVVVDLLEKQGAGHLKVRASYMDLL